MRNSKNGFKSHEFKELRPVRFFPKDFFGPILPHNDISYESSNKLDSLIFNSIRAPELIHSEILKKTIRRVLINKNFKILKRPTEDNLSSTSTERIILPNIRNVSNTNENNTVRSISVKRSTKVPLIFGTHKKESTELMRIDKNRIPLAPISDKDEDSNISDTRKTGFFGGAASANENQNGKRLKAKRTAIRTSSKRKSAKYSKRSYRIIASKQDNMIQEDNIPTFTFGRKFR